MNGVNRASRVCALAAQRAHGRTQASGFRSLTLRSLLASVGVAQQKNAASIGAAQRQAAMKAALWGPQVRSILSAGEPLVVATKTEVDKAAADAFVERTALGAQDRQGAARSA